MSKTLIPVTVKKMTQETPSPNQRSTDQRITDIESRLEGVDREFSQRTNILLDEILVLTQQMDTLTNRVDQLTDQVDRLAEQVDRLAEGQQVTQSNVSQLAVLMVQFAQNAEADRAIVRGLQEQVTGIQTENRRILDYLFGQQRNGNGGGEPQG